MMQSWFAGPVRRLHSATLCALRQAGEPADETVQIVNQIGEAVSRLAKGLGEVGYALPSGRRKDSMLLPISWVLASGCAAHAVSEDGGDNQQQNEHPFRAGAQHPQETERRKP